MGLSPEPRSSRWAAAATRGARRCVFVVDLVTGAGRGLLIAPLYGIAPLVAASTWQSDVSDRVRSPARSSAAGRRSPSREISSTTIDEMDTTNGAVFVFTVALLGCSPAAPRSCARRREAAAARARLLAEVGELLSTAQDPAARLAAVAAAAVPAVADRCTIDLTAPGGEPERAAAGPATARRPRSSRRSPASRGGAAPEASRSELVVPLEARGVRLGALELGIDGSGRRFGAEDRALAEELARRCSVALDNARLVAEARTAEGELLRGLRAARRDLRARPGRPRGPRPRPALRAHQRPHGRDQRPAAPRSTSGARSPRSSPRSRPSRPTCAACSTGGEPLTELEVAGTTAAAPGVDREWIVSYWPVRRRDDHRVVGVGAVVFEVTERRAAERALREQTARYESLLLALSQVGEAMVVARRRRPRRVREPRLRGDLRLHAPRSSRRCRRSSTSSSRSSARTPASAHGCGFAGRGGPGNQLTIRHRDGHRDPDGGRRRAARGRRPPPDGRRRPRRHGACPRARPSASGSCTAPPSWPRRAPPSTRCSTRSATLDALARLSVRELADTCVILLGGSVGAIRRVATRRARPGGRGTPGGARRALPVRRPPLAPAARRARHRPRAPRRASRRGRHPARGRAPPRAGRRSSRPSARCSCR